MVCVCVCVCVCVLSLCCLYFWICKSVLPSKVLGVTVQLRHCVVALLLGWLIEAAMFSGRKSVHWS